MAQEGSPPQVRGKHVLHIACSVQTGITPAGAGKTFMSRTRGCTAKDHPRRCGENAVTDKSKVFHKGSPPQVRGKRRSHGYIPDRRGITPAGAGKTLIVAGFVRMHKDHPRRCGENSDEDAERFLEAGSPPQVRGKLAG